MAQKKKRKGTASMHRSESIETEYRRRMTVALMPGIFGVGVTVIGGLSWVLLAVLGIMVSWSMVATVRDRAIVLRRRYHKIMLLETWALAKDPSSLERQNWREYGQGTAQGWFVYFDRDNGEWWRDLDAFVKAHAHDKERAGRTAVNSAMFMRTYAANRGWFSAPRPRWNDPTRR
jgi:hypothetical protein